MKQGRSEGNENTKTSLLVVLSITLVLLLAAASAQAQPPGRAQYNGRTGVGHDAADDAVTASEAFDDTETVSPQEGAPSAEQSAPSAAEGQPAPSEPGTAGAGEIAQAAASGHEAHTSLKSLPDTGGGSPQLLGGLLVGAGVLMRFLARRALRAG